MRRSLGRRARGELLRAELVGRQACQLARHVGALADDEARLGAVARAADDQRFQRTVVLLEPVLLQPEAARHSAGDCAVRVALERQCQPVVAAAICGAHRLPAEGERRLGRPVVAAANQQQPSRGEAIGRMQQR